MLLGDICTYITRGFRKPLYDDENRRHNFHVPIFEEQVYTSEKWYYITISSLIARMIRTVCVLDKPRRDLECFKLHNKDIVMPLTGPFFMPVIYDNVFPYYSPEKVKSNITVLVSGNMCIIEPDIEKINPYYLYACLGKLYEENYFEKIARGKKKNIITKDDILNAKIPVASVGEMQKIADEAIMYRSEIAQAVIEKYRHNYGLEAICKDM